MHIVRTDQTAMRELDPREAAREADRHARLIEEIYIDIEELDPVTCPPDRRFFLKDKQAWIYDHGNISELVFVRVDPEW